MSTIVVISSFKLMFIFGIIKITGMIWNIITISLRKSSLSSPWGIASWLHWWLRIMIRQSWMSTIVIISSLELVLIFGIIKVTSFIFFGASEVFAFIL